MARSGGFDETTVLERARDPFWSTGFAGTSIDEVAAATGLGKGNSVADATIPGPATDIPIRTYRPNADLAPTAMYFHGGGWMTGSGPPAGAAVEDRWVAAPP
jgi:acetyl esterase/lipase